MPNKNNKPEEQILVIFGATGDLSKRKLIPALYALNLLDMLPEKFLILGAGRSGLDDDEFRDTMKEALQNFSKQDGRNKFSSFLKKIYYAQADPNKENLFSGLGGKIEFMKKDNSFTKENIIFYLSTPPSLYQVIPERLAAAGLNKEDNGWKRLVIEKPFGYDLDSSMALDTALQKSWKESQIYRIDHYLGKETVQNLLVTRFSNGIFEPLWNRNFIHHIEITSAERIGVENRGNYYDDSGALRDMIQNHLLQVTGLIAMEPPASMNADSIRNETVKVLQSLRPIRKEEVKNVAVRGQYLASTISGKPVKGYREEEGVNPDSRTETYAALKFYIDNWRWGGVPFYVRTGKQLPARVTEAVIHFKPTPHRLFAPKGSCDTSNQLIIRIQPDEGILLRMGMKTPGAGFDVQNVSMDFHYSDLQDVRIPDAYERLLLDSMTGDKTLYSRIDAVTAAWEFMTPVLDAWKNDTEIPVHGYPAGTWGPDVADNLIEEPEMNWRQPCAELSGDDNYCKLL